MMMMMTIITRDHFHGAVTQHMLLQGRLIHNTHTDIQFLGLT